MYRLATKRTKKRIKDNASVSFFHDHVTTCVLVTAPVLAFLFTGRDAAITMNSAKMEITH